MPDGHPPGPGNLGPPPAVFRVQAGRRSKRPRGRWLWLGVVAALVALFIGLNVAKYIYLDVLWFRSVGYGSVYTTRITTQLWLFLAGSGIALAVIVPNVLVARRLAPTADVPGFEVSPELRELFASATSTATRRALWGVASGILLLAVIGFGSAAAGQWQAILLFAHAQSFGREDPQFHRDLGFYVFQLPVYRFVVGWLLTAVVVATISVVVIYVARGILYGFRIDAPRPILRHVFSIQTPSRIKLHISVLLVALLLLLIARSYLGRFALVYSTQGVDLGAFYTDIHATLPMLYIRIGAASISVVLILVGLYRGGLALPAGAVALWIGTWVLTAIYPAVVQRFFVQPNEFTREEPYLARNIEMTRWAYGLDQIDEREFPVNAQATEQDVAANQETIDNVRLWDPEPLRAALNQLQTIRPLFEFQDVDVDRYTIDGKYRQVMLSVRELNSAKLPPEAQTWVNRTLQFTHGYGYTVAAVNESGPDGSPSLIVKDIPLQGPLQTTRPEVYFGEQPDKFIVVDGTEPEFTPVAGGENVQTRFEAQGGVRLSSLWRRALYAWSFLDPNILISGAINSNSRIIYRRNVQQRIHEIAPFLQLDADPYIVVDQDNMYWIQDAYTVSDKIPYSHSTNGLNYVRNTVKVVVNAYSGDVSFYVTQPEEPIIKAYMAVFPRLFRPLADMPVTLRAHLRYPEDLFSLQTQAYLRYHIRDPRQFYQKEDQWDIPTEIFGEREQTLRPYYVIAPLPGETRTEFMLILPFVPRNRTNAIGWIAARSDGNDYGKLVSFRFPSGESVPGPTQVERRIDSDGRVSQQLTLWNQAGSKVIRGDLLMIPVGGANLFFEPLYLAATTGGNEIPQLKRIVVVNGDSVAMEPTLARALDVLFGRALPSGVDSAGGPASPTTASPTPAPSATPPVSPSPLSGDLASLVAQAEDAYSRAQALLKNGDFAGYGTEIERLKQILDRLQQLTGTPVPAR